MRKIWIAVPFLILVALVLVYVFFEGCLNWKAIGALGSIFVLIWAVFQQAILKWLDRPILEILKYKHEPPYFRPAAELDKNTGIKVAEGYYVNLVLVNKGKTVAYNAQPHLSAIWEFKEGSWYKEKNWIPVGLLWIFDEINIYSNKPTEEKNLVPERDYRFNLLALSTAYPNYFNLLLNHLTTGQRWKYSIGKYCFEVTISAARSKSIKRYYEVDFLESINDNFDSVKEKIKIKDLNKQPK